MKIMIKNYKERISVEYMGERNNLYKFNRDQLVLCTHRRKKHLEVKLKELFFT